MNARHVALRAACALTAVWALAPFARAAVTVIDDFEANEGHFAQAPNFSGSSAGFAAASTADRTTEAFFSGAASEKLFIDDVVGTNDPGGGAWRLRFLSGGGTPANNVTLDSTGFVGYWLRTTTPNLRAGIMIDDGAALERSVRTAIIADGEWHLYQWDFDNDAQWDAFAGTAPNGAIDAAQVTIDALYVDAALAGDGSDQDATFYIDAVSFDPTGEIAVPEPTALGLVGVGALMLTRRRRA